jgi:S-adenosylmethionine hydrolase
VVRQQDVSARYDCLTLLTDYGYSGGFAGVLRAVAFRIAPSVPVIDLDHAIPPQDIRLGALRLERLMAYVPAGVHVAVVDPGVGGDRRSVALISGGRAFVGPDNGLLLWAARRCGEIEYAVSLDVEKYWLSPRSRTFDGRDIFVPVAAHLASGVELSSVGSEVSPDTLVELSRPRAVRIGKRSMALEVLQVDWFGNLQLSGDLSTAEDLGLRFGIVVEVRIDSTPGPVSAVHAPFCERFGDVPEGSPLVLIDSDGCVAVSVNGGDASQLLGSETLRRVRTGDRVVLTVTG